MPLVFQHVLTVFIIAFSSAFVLVPSKKPLDGKFHDNALGKGIRKVVLAHNIRVVGERSPSSWGPVVGVSFGKRSAIFMIVGENESSSKRRGDVAYNVNDNNGAGLGEGNIEDALADLKLAQAKLEILQDVVRKLKLKNDQVTMEWKVKYDDMKRKRDEEQQKGVQLQNDLSAMKERMSTEKSRHDKLLADFKAAQELERENSIKELRKYVEQETRLQNHIATLTERLATMENSLNSQERKYNSLEESTNRELERRKKLVEREKLKAFHLTEELNAANTARDEAFARVKEMEDLKATNDEAIEIAKAAVSAAERREAMLLGKYESLKSDLTKVEKERRELESKLSFAEEEKRKLLQQIEDAAAQTNGRSEQEDKLQKEVEALKEQIHSLKMTHGSQLRAERRENEARLVEAQEEHDREMQQIRQSVILNRVDQPKKRSLWQRIRRIGGRRKSD